jgi:uncharacterized protein YbcI
MADTVSSRSVSVLESVSNALVRLHKEQFGRGPTSARSYFVGEDGLLCIMRDAMLPAERKMVEMGQEERVRETRIAFQAAAADEFIHAIEQIVGRKVVGFASGLDAQQAIVFENFVFESAAGR